MADNEASEFNGVTVTVDFVRGRNALLVRADLGPLFTDYYLHLADQSLRYTPEQDTIFKDALTAFTLHCAARPLNEHLAWTLNLQQPLLNVFLTGDNEDCLVTGRLFTENVRTAAANVFYSDTVPGRGAEKRRSVANFTGAEVFRAVEDFYATSEQRPARIFHLGEDRFSLLISHPDCDEVWVKTVDVAAINAIEQHETLARIEQRGYRWHCGCTQAKILGAIAPAFRADPEGIFGEGESIRVECPRCAALHTLTREAMEAYLAQHKPAGA